MPEFSSAYERWQQEAYENDEREAADAGLEEYSPTRPNSFQGNIACGLVSQSTGYKDILKGVDRKILAIETESGAVAHFCYDNGIDFVSIRGISDNADEKKKDHESLTKDVSRRVAAYNAFSFLKAQISENLFFRRYLLEHRPSGGTQPPLPMVDEFENPLADAQERLLSTTVTRLRETNQSFKALPEGAVLPLPRIRARPSKVAPAAGRRGDPLEIREGVAKFQRIFAVIPRVFPDKSLAWLIAHALHYEQWAERQFVPIVIDGEAVRPPRGTVERLAGLNLQQIRDNGGTPVFIIDSFSLGSSTNASFLAEQMKANEHDRFIVLSHDDPNIREVEEFVARSNSEHVEIVDTSFAEITSFLASHFSMASDAAQVVALRLRNVFKKFGLQVHPTFFAGIPQELIASILDANRRGELIQLAVDGYLTHVVSIDKEKGRLSRTTRADFLRLLIRQSKIEKRPMTEESLATFTSQFFDSRGYPNDPINFVDRFFDTNIFIKKDGRVEFGLTFVESYFTALELCESSELACAYFDPLSPDFDYRAFDLYAELCAHADFVSSLLSRIDDLPLLAAARTTPSRLETGDIYPQLMKRAGIASAVNHRVEIASKAIAEGRDETQEKQHLLDVADRVFDEAFEREGAADEDSPDPALKEVSDALTLWGVAVVLLGQGAEKLDDTQKKLLAANVARLGAIIVDEWTNVFASIDYAKLKAHLTEDGTLAELIDPTLDLPSTITPKELVEALVDITEMSLIGEPLRGVLNHLADEASHRVVLPALKAVQPETFLEKLLTASWLAEVDSTASKPVFKKLIREFPDAPFLRATLVSYYVFRVYWSISDKQTRLQLLEYADSLARPLGKKIPVREIAKQIDTNDSNGER